MILDHGKYMLAAVNTLRWYSSSSPSASQNRYVSLAQARKRVMEANKPTLLEVFFFGRSYLPTVSCSSLFGTLVDSSPLATCFLIPGKYVIRLPYVLILGKDITVLRAPAK